MAHSYQPDAEPRPSSNEPHELLNRILGLDSIKHSSTSDELCLTPESLPERQPSTESTRRRPRQVVAGLPRSQTFKRQQSERRHQLAPVEEPSDQRRAPSVDRRSNRPGTASQYSDYSNTRLRTPSIYSSSYVGYGNLPLSMPPPPSSSMTNHDSHRMSHLTSTEPGRSINSFPTPSDGQSMTPSQFNALIHDELERVWILNLSMHFRDQSKREKFFVTYRETEQSWRRVTISLDYRSAEPNSLETELLAIKLQREKSAKIYESIRESLQDVQFYDTVTNLKLQTTEGRLHVHVVEDGNEIIDFPSISMVRHLQCRRVRERDITFLAHMSGFVYKVRANDHILIKKEIPSPETIDEFLYEVNALHALQFSSNVVQFYGVVVDDADEYVKGLLIAYADQGALLDVIYDNCKDSHVGIPWRTREKWARQIVKGLSDVHETGFVQGDFTLSNVVIDSAGDAKIIDINRRGCPLGWEPPEASALLECNQRLTLFIGVKSDLYQLGMVLWALAMNEDEPESQGRPLMLGPEINIPDWYRRITEICLSYDPRSRMHASQLLQMIPPPEVVVDATPVPAKPTTTTTRAAFEFTDNKQVATTSNLSPRGAPGGASRSNWSERVGSQQGSLRPLTYDPFYTNRGRSPPSPMPSETSRGLRSRAGWHANRTMAPLYNALNAKITPPSQSRDESIPVPSLTKDTPPSRLQHQSANSSEIINEPEERITPDIAAGDGILTPKGDIWRDEAPSISTFKSYGEFRHEAVLGSFETTDTKPYQFSRFDEWLDIGEIGGLQNRSSDISLELEANDNNQHTSRPNYLERQDTIRISFYDPDEREISSWISRVTTPDCENEGGAQLARSETDEAIRSQSQQEVISEEAAVTAEYTDRSLNSLESILKHTLDTQDSNRETDPSSLLPNYTSSLAGIGAGHAAVDSINNFTQMRITDDEFASLDCKETVPTFLMTN